MGLLDDGTLLCCERGVIAEKKREREEGGERELLCVWESNGNLVVAKATSRPNGPSGSSRFCHRRPREGGRAAPSPPFLAPRRHRQSAPVHYRTEDDDDDGDGGGDDEKEEDALPLPPPLLPAPISQ